MEPPDEWDGTFEPAYYNDEINYPATVWKKKFAFFPKKSYVSGNRVWLKRIYCKINMYPIRGGITKKWLTEEEYLIERLSGRA